MATPTPPEFEPIRNAVVAGDLETAAAALGPRLESNPGDVEARYWLASALARAGDSAGFRQALDDARNLHSLTLARSLGVDLQLCQSNRDHARQIAGAFYAQHCVAIASAFFAVVIEGAPPDPSDLLTYALALQHQGRVPDAIAAFRAAGEVAPTPAVDQFLLYPHLLLRDQHAYVKVAREWAMRHAPPVSVAPFANPPADSRKLRIGYVAPGFATSQVRQFIAPILLSHDPDRVEVVLYPATAETEGVWPSWIAVHPIGHLDDAAAADLIRRDGIDVLADCWGHTAGSRLSVFARRPAPVQVAWINFVQTTGLPQMDHVLHADTDPALDLDGLFSETIWPIGPVFNAFAPAYDRLPPVETPAMASGVVTFGSFNHPCKLSDETVRGWSRVLCAVPGSRLLLKYRYFADPVLQRATEARFAAEGVAPERIAFEGESRGTDYLEAFGRVDLALDTAPAPGSTTTLEALANGLPVLTLTGTPMTLPGFHARCMALAVGLPELVTPDWDGFVARAVALTADVGTLNDLRARVRPGFDNGPISDGPGFSRRLETAFVEMFERARRSGFRQAGGGRPAAG